MSTGDKKSIIERIESALAAWKEEHNNTLPDIMYLGMRDAFALDRALAQITLRFMDVQVAMSDAVAGIALAKIY